MNRLRTRTLPYELPGMLVLSSAAAQKRRYYRHFQRTGPHLRKLWTPPEDARITAKSQTDCKLSRALGPDDAGACRCLSAGVGHVRKFLAYSQMDVRCWQLEDF